MAIDPKPRRDRGNRHWIMRLDEHTRARWDLAARAGGEPLAQLVKRAVSALLDYQDALQRSPEEAAAALRRFAAEGSQGDTACLEACPTCGQKLPPAGE